MPSDKENNCGYQRYGEEHTHISRAALGKPVRFAALRSFAAVALAVVLVLQGRPAPSVAHAQPTDLGMNTHLMRKHTVQVRNLPTPAVQRAGVVQIKPFQPSPRPASSVGPTFPAAAPLRSGVLAPRSAAGRDGASTAAPAPQSPSSGPAFQAAPSTAVLERLTVFSGLGQNGKAPPDTQMAVGPTHVIEMVNITGQIYDKASNTVGSAFDLGTFFGGTGATGRGTDPRVLYDAPSGRFFAAYELLPAGGDEIDLAVSNTSDPGGTWVIYTVRTNNSSTLFDQPKLGLTNDKVTLSWNDYDSSGNFAGVETIVIQMAGLLSGAGSVPATLFGPDTGRFQIVPAYSVGSTNDQYMMWKSGTDVKVLTVTGVPGVNTVNISESSFGIGTADAPPPAAQPPGGDANIATNDDRMLSVVWQNNHLWGVFNVKCTPNTDTTPRSCQRFIQVSTGGGLSLVTNFNLGFIGGDLYFGAVMLDLDDDLFAGFTASSSSLFPTAVAVGVPGGNFASSTSGDFYASGTQAYVCGCSGIRWGDYSGIGRDPIDPTDVWVGEEIGGLSNGVWGTAFDRVTLSGPRAWSISPTSGPELSVCGTNVTVQGMDFVAGGTSVNFGTVTSPGVSVNSPDQLVAQAPSQASGTVDVTVTTANGTSPIVAGNQFTYLTDITPPTTSASVSPPPVGGWNKAPATVNLNAADNACGSGVRNIIYSALGAQSIGSTTVVGDSASVVLSNEGTTTVSFFATDNVSNVESAKSIDVKIDNTPPNITTTKPANGEVYRLNQAVVASYSCTDGGSGVATCAGTVASGANIDTTSVGVKMFTVNATDEVGNVSSQTVSYYVTYNMSYLPIVLH